MRWAATALTLAALAGCQTTMDTPSGRPEVTVAAPPDAIRALVVNDVINKGFTIRSDTPYQLIVDRQSKNFAVNLLLGSELNPTVNIRLAIAFVPLGDSTRVVVDQSVVTNPGTGLEKLTPINPANAGKQVAEVQSWLNSLHARIGQRPKGPNG